MKNIALYRKYRPQTFDEVIGQDSVVDVLVNSIKDDSISHAYLFTGSRGTGKTSIARIFSKEIGVSANDMYEIDAASNRGIDDVRALREAVQALPFESPYKVYIIDEVHMLTKEAFNALLKTLEEPPEHVIFVLATTELHKLPDTVVSRCEVHNFKSPTEKILKTYVDDIAKKEEYKLETGSSDLIALLGDGSFRDALGAFQKITSSVKGKEIKIKDIENTTGVPKRAIIQDIIKNIHKKDLEGALSSLNKVEENGTNMKVFITLLLQYMRYVLLLRFAPNLEDRIKSELDEDTFKLLKDIARDVPSGVTSSTLRELLVGSTNIGNSLISVLPLELALIRVLGEDN